VRVYVCISFINYTRIDIDKTKKGKNEEKLH